MRLVDLDANQMVLIATMLITLSAVAFLELRYMRSRRKGARETLDLPDQVHNAILATKAIREALARGGVRSLEADDLVREAEDAVQERNFHVAMELTERAKGVLRAAKAKQARQGDLSKLETTETKGDAGEVTTKERLMKELPPNYAPSKFSINLARDEIASAKTDGREAAEAEQLLASAQASFDAQDYATALKQAVRARRSLEGVSTPATEPAPEVPTPMPTGPSGTARPCPSCGSPVAADDAFCRKCGVAVPKARTCPSCGAPVTPEDAFCRTCGTRMPAATGNP